MLHESVVVLVVLKFLYTFWHLNLGALSLQAVIILIILKIRSILIILSPFLLSHQLLYLDYLALNEIWLHALP